MILHDLTELRSSRSDGFGTGCAEHRHGRVYDPYYSDYHQWGPDEDAYYHRWYGETYHDRGYREYRRLNRDEQRNYWTWRHSDAIIRSHWSRQDTNLRRTSWRLSFCSIR